MTDVLFFVCSLRTEDVFHADASVRKTQLRLALEHLELDDITKTMLDEMDACDEECRPCLLYTSPSPRDLSTSRMPSSA